MSKSNAENFVSFLPTSLPTPRTTSRAPHGSLSLPSLLLLDLLDPVLLGGLFLLFLRLLPRGFLISLLPDQTQPGQIGTRLVRFALGV